MRKTGTTSSSVLADVKGDPQIAKGFKRFITSTGYKRLELKTDGEPALVEFVTKIKKMSEVEVIRKFCCGCVGRGMGVDAWLPVRSLVLCFPCARCFPAHNRGTRGHLAISLRLGSLLRREPSEEDPCLPQELLWRLEALPHPLSFCPHNLNWWPWKA